LPQGSTVKAGLKHYAYLAYIHRARIDFIAQGHIEVGEPKNFSKEIRHNPRYEKPVIVLRREKTTITIFYNKNNTTTFQVVSLSLEDCEEAFYQLAEEIGVFEFEKRPLYLEVYIRYHERKEEQVCKAIEVVSAIWGVKRKHIVNYDRGREVSYLHRARLNIANTRIDVKSYRHRDWRKLSAEEPRRHPKLEVTVYFSRKRPVHEEIQLAKRLLATIANYANLKPRDIQPAGEEGLYEVETVPEPAWLRLLYARGTRKALESLARRPLPYRKDQLAFLLLKGLSLKQAAKLMRISDRRAKQIAREMKEEGVLEREGRRWIVHIERLNANYTQTLRASEEKPIIKPESLNGKLSKLKIKNVRTYSLEAELDGQDVIVVLELPLIYRFVCPRCGQERHVLATWGEPKCPVCGASPPRLTLVIPFIGETHGV